MMRRYNRWHLRFDQPDPYGGSYDLTDPQSLNRYTYADNDPVNLTDPSGLMAKCDGIEVIDPATGQPTCIPTQNHGVVTVTDGGNPINDGLASLLAYGVRMRQIYLVADPRLVSGGNPLIDAGKCPPTGQQLANDPTVIAAMQQAWRESRIGTRAGVRREQGGWIYARNGKIIIRRAKHGRSAALDLSDAPQVAGAMLVGNFHTHPGFASQGMNPGVDDHDKFLEFGRNVPGLIISQGMIITPYGPERRGSDPSSAMDPNNSPLGIAKGYPGNAVDTRGCKP